jgi:hypothetical protein
MPQNTAAVKWVFCSCLFDVICNIQLFEDGQVVNIFRMWPTKCLFWAEEAPV